MGVGMRAAQLSEVNIALGCASIRSGGEHGFDVDVDLAAHLHLVPVRRPAKQNRAAAHTVQQAWPLTSRGARSQADPCAVPGALQASGGARGQGLKVSVSC